MVPLEQFAGTDELQVAVTVLFRACGGAAQALSKLPPSRIKSTGQIELRITFPSCACRVAAVCLSGTDWQDAPNDRSVQWYNSPNTHVLVPKPGHIQARLEVESNIACAKAGREG